LTEKGVILSLVDVALKFLCIPIMLKAFKLFWFRISLRVEDGFRYSGFVREVAGWIALFRGIVLRDGAGRAEGFTRALSLAESDVLRRIATRSLHGWIGFERAREIWRCVALRSSRYREKLAHSTQIDRSIILKMPDDSGERGVILLTFEYNWVRLVLGMGETEWNAFYNQYDIILSTSWSPTDYAALALVLSMTDRHVFVQVCNFADVEVIEAFHPRLRCLPTLPCDWINSENYVPASPMEREIDILMVANWGKFKRHWEFFSALSAMPAQLRVVLIGQREAGRSQNTIRQLADAFNVPQSLEFYESIAIDEVSALQCRAKVSLIMTRREGCCVAAVESLFAGCALGMREDAHVGPLSYIHDETGARLRPAHLASDLMDLIERSKSLCPAEWARKFVEASVSHVKVNSFLRDQAIEMGNTWVRDIVQPQWRPHPTFHNASDKAALRQAYEDLHFLSPEVFSADLAETSHR
jgi:glycosyltransferase involved in cell wall biosynthesis